MNYRLRILSEAESDIREAYHWYQERRRGLGAEFIGAFEACLGSIQGRPLAFPVVFEKVRRALLKRFPYGVFFVTEQNTITVLACFHAKRDPRQIRGRL
jgi:plasmid stabilization system protein ParE